MGASDLGPSDLRAMADLRRALGGCIGLLFEVLVLLGRSSLGRVGVSLRGERDSSRLVVSEVRRCERLKNVAGDEDILRAGKAMVDKGDIKFCDTLRKRESSGLGLNAPEVKSAFRGERASIASSEMLVICGIGDRIAV